MRRALRPSYPDFHQRPVGSRCRTADRDCARDLPRQSEQTYRLGRQVKMARSRARAVPDRFVPLLSPQTAQPRRLQSEIKIDVVEDPSNTPVVKPQRVLLWTKGPWSAEIGRTSWTSRYPPIE